MLAAAAELSRLHCSLLPVYPQSELLHSLRLPLYTQLAALTVTRPPSTNMGGRLETRWDEIFGLICRTVWSAL